MTSPLIPRRVETQNQQTMSFAAAMNEVLRGEKVRRISWPDQDVHIFLRSDVYHIHNEKGDHRFLLSPGDVLGDDWVVARTVN